MTDRFQSVYVIVRCILFECMQTLILYIKGEIAEGIINRYDRYQLEIGRNNQIEKRKIILDIVVLNRNSAVVFIPPIKQFILKYTLFHHKIG